jgi:hypothetical protein
MMIVGAVPYVRGGLVIISQVLGGIAAAALVKALTKGDINVRVSIGGGISVVQALFMEMFLTAMLVFAIFMLAAEKHKATFIAPIGIGLALFIAELFGVYYTGGALNPARAFGPCVVAHSFYHYHWIYWVGPALGSLLASGFYMFIKALEYETVNPEQDDDEDPHKKFDPTKAAAGQTFKPAYSPDQYAADSNRYESRSNDYQSPSVHAARPYTADTNSATGLNGSSYPMANMAATHGSPGGKRGHEARNLSHGGMDNSYGNGPYVETGRAGPLP